MEEQARPTNGIEYRGLTGEAAIEEAYRRIFERYDTPKNEADIMTAALLPDSFRKLFDAYFAIHPEEAQQIVKEHRSRYTGIRRILEPFAYSWNQIRGIRYRAAEQCLKQPLEQEIEGKG